MIIKKFEEQVKRFPDKIAVKAGDRFLTYYELDEYANRIADEIISLGQQGEEDTAHRVALLFEHGIDMLVGVISVLKADRIYVPFDVSYPIKRLAYMLENSGSLLILTNRLNLPLAGKLIDEAKHKAEILNIESISRTNYRIHQDRRLRKADGDKPAYILYTSGSTGWPKGVVQTHRSVLYFVRNWVERFSITEADHMTLLPAFSHDAAVMDIFVALLSGVCLYPYSIKIDPDGHGLYNFLKREKITIWHSVPSLFRYFGGTLPGTEHFDKIRWVLLGGEPVRSHDLELHKTFFPKAALGIIYGQTESSVNNICIISQENSFNDISLGEPLDETEILLVDKDGDLIEGMGVGEIVVASDYIAQGYWQDEEKSNAVFINDDEGERLYLTGDMGRYTGRGIIKMMGRKDFQVKIRGFRVETGEIETVLLKMADIQQAAVVAKDAESTAPYLCAFIAAAREMKVVELREFLSQQLPDYMIPTSFIQLDLMPFTQSGKLDKNALMMMKKEPLKLDVAYEAPQTELQKKVAEIWKEVLGRERIGIHENLFDLGGNSFDLVTINNRVSKFLNRKIPMVKFFEYPTINELAQLIMASTPSIYSAIKPVEEKEYYPATSDQKRMFILNQFEGISTTYNLPGVWKVEGDIDRQNFERIVQKLINRHDMFRTSFKMINDDLVQMIHKKVDFPIQYFDVEKQDLKSESAIKKITETFIQPFDLNIAPLLRIAWVKVSANENFLLLDSHHIITDGVSENIYVQDFYRLYLGEELPGLKLRYRDYSEWQNSLESSGQLKNQEEYWLNVFKGEIPVLDLPDDYPRPAVQSFAGDIVRFGLSMEVIEQINRLAKETGTTLFMVLLAMFNLLLHKYTGQEDIVIGTIIAGRNNADLENIIGFFAKTLALRNYPTPNKPFDFFLEELRRNTLKSFENHMYPFSRLIEKLKLTKDRSRNPLFDAAFVLQNTGMSLSEKYEGAIGLKLIPQRFENNTSLFDLYFQAVEANARILCCFQYNTRLFKRETIELMRERFLMLIKNILNSKSEKIRDINFSIPIEVEIRKTEEVEFDL